MTSYPKIHFRLFQSLRMRLTYPKPLRPVCDWLTVFVTRSSSFQEHKGQVWKLSLEEKKTGMMKEGQQRGDWWSPVSRQKRGVMSSGREKETNVERVVCLHWLKRLWSGQKIWCTWSACCNWLVTLMSPSCVYWFKLCANTKICKYVGGHTHTRILTHTYTEALLSDFDMCFY